jgi:hypothetical protein
MEVQRDIPASSPRIAARRLSGALRPEHHVEYSPLPVLLAFVSLDLDVHGQ